MLLNFEKWKICRKKKNNKWTKIWQTRWKAQLCVLSISGVLLACWSWILRCTFIYLWGTCCILAEDSSDGFGDLLLELIFEHRILQLHDSSVACGLFCFGGLWCWLGGYLIEACCKVGCRLIACRFVFRCVLELCHVVVYELDFAVGRQFFVMASYANSFLHRLTWHLRFRTLRHSVWKGNEEEI